MSVGHSEASFNHSCLKVPVDSFSRKPTPKYERISSAKLSNIKQAEDNKKNYTVSDSFNNFKSVKSYLEFYESIPDYSELHHLSNEEFYSRLKSLKLTQKRFFSDSEVLDGEEESSNDKIYNYTRSDLVQDKSNEKTESPNLCTCCSYCLPEREYCNYYEKKCDTKADTSIGVKQTPPKINIVSDNDNTSDLFEFKKHSGYEADQESSLLQAGDRWLNKAKNYSDKLNISDEYLNTYSRCRSLPITPGCECDTPEFCHRFSDLSFRNDGYNSRRIGSSYNTSEKDKSSLSKKPKKTFGRPVPLTSRIPLFEKMMLEKEGRRRIIHDRRTEALRSLVKPFSFTKREEERERLRMVCSNPELTSTNTPTVRFKAKPIPKNLFSNYAYERMKEDEFYRALKKRIRAEELLKSASLPPSMAIRERKSRSKSLDFLDSRTPKRGWNKISAYKKTYTALGDRIEYGEKCKSGTPQKRKPGWASTRRIQSATDSSTEVSPYESIVESRRKTRPRSALGTGRNNLASVLRIEAARMRLEKELEEKLRESRLKDEAKLKQRLVRMTPAWKALNYDKNEDLALRLIARRQEEKLKQQKHMLQMESMYEKVYRMPPLFHQERFAGNQSATRNSNARKDSTNELLLNGNLETQKTDEAVEELQEDNDRKSSDLPASPDQQESRTRQSSEFTASDKSDKSEKAKPYESDDSI